MTKTTALSFAVLVGTACMTMSGAAPNLPKTGLANSTHDINTQGCKSCHAPHNGSSANGGIQGTGLILLWSRSFPSPSNTFGVYDSATMANKAIEVGGSDLTTSSDVRMYSLLCLSCHDGVTSSFSPAMKPANIIGYKASFGGGLADSLGLTNDHPINMPYDPTKNSSLQAVATVSGALPLYGSNNTVQCATCHDPHNDVNTNYLRQANNTSHCTTCHL
jgi:predicted CXXCH cytochrome family protein